MLLDRRVRRFAPWADPGFFSALSDELRKNFINLYAADALGDRWASVFISLSDLTINLNSHEELSRLGLDYFASVFIADTEPAPAEAELAPAAVLGVEVAFGPSVFADSL